MYGYWGCILVIGMISNLIITLTSWKSSRSRSDVAGGASRTIALPPPVNAAWQWVRAHFVIPSALMTYHRRPLFAWQIPTRIEALVVIMYWIISLVLCCVNYNAFEGNA